MIRLAVRALIYFGSAAIGILVASSLLDGVTVQASGFMVVVAVYAVIQSVLTPFATKLAAQNAAAFLGGTGLVAAFVALMAAVAFGDALSISGLGTWIAATVVVWLVTALATLLLPWALVKAGIDAARTKQRAA